jgi:polyphosphate kinase 2
VDDRQYQKQLRRLQSELIAVQEWVKHSGQRIVIVFEGRDAAGKGGIIKAITQRVSPRVFRTVALPAPSDREKSQMYMQRYVQHFPAGGEVVIFDRSWYNRAGVEPVMGFCSEEDTDHFLRGTPDFEREMVKDGIILLKYWLEVSNKEQEKRFKDRIRRQDKQWKLSGMDLESRRRWYDYSRARDRMLEATDTDDCPWHIVPSDNKKIAHLNCISHLLEHIPYQPLGTAIITLPKRDKTNAYDDRETMKDRRYVPESYAKED